MGAKQIFNNVLQIGLNSLLYNLIIDNNKQSTFYENIYRR
uniref:Uncharacterized protein n=1 Tax=viral metagenome TaxID=1070528 RepID=A0A6C0JGU8_9ZZZZ